MSESGSPRGGAQPSSGGGSGSHLVVELSPDPSAAPAARRALRSLLVRTGQEEWSDAAELACTELVTNAVLHAHTPLTVTVASSATELRVEVSDASPELPRRRTRDATATTGRGLLLVAQVASEHGVRVDPVGKTVWFTLRGHLPGDPGEPSVEDLLDMWGDEPDHDVGSAPDGHASPPGRASDPAGAVATGARVRLLGLPPSLWLAAEEHHRTLLRELVLYEANPDEVAGEGMASRPWTGVDHVAVDAAHALIAGAAAVAVDLARATGTARRPLPEDHPADLPWVPASLDLELDVPSAGIGGFEALQDALDLAERLAAAGRLLARPGLPEIVAVRDWACEQVLAQSAGAPAGAWPGTDHERFVAREPLPDEGWDLEQVRTAVEPLVAADESNRIVALSPAMAELVLWDADDLLGRRVVTLVPPELREAHVAGFSRHLTTGQARLLGIPLVLPVLRADGSIVRCTVTIDQAIDQAAEQRGRRLYLARFEPFTVSGPQYG